MSFQRHLSIQVALIPKVCTKKWTLLLNYFLFLTVFLLPFKIISIIFQFILKTMNRNLPNTNNKTLNKNSHSRSQKLSKSLNQTHKFYSQTPAHFLNVNFSSIITNKSCKSSQSNLKHHFASSTELISTPFQTKAYVPPHLNSSQVFRCITSECLNWQIRPSSSKKLFYDNMYNALESRYQKAIPCGSRLKKWTAGSKIKNMVYEDRTRYGFQKPYKLYMEEKSESEADISYMQDSQRGKSEQDEGNRKSSRMISIGNQSIFKGDRNFIETQI